MTEIRKFLVSGRVQGVFFRESTRKVARSLGINGWAINLPDGRVEVVAQGAAAAMEELRNYLRRGPTFARVDDLVESGFDGAVDPGFRTG